MRKMKEVLRLSVETGLSQRGIAQALGLGLGTVSTYLKRARQAGINWPLPAEMDERTLGRLLFPSQPATGQRRFVEPDFQNVHQELKRKGVTKQLLWQEYRQQHPDDGYSYAQFCHRYREWLGRQQRSMRQVHRAGEKLFVDYCGPTMPVVNSDTGEIRQAQVFVAVLGTSNYTFACASWSQKQQDWLSAHVQAFEFFGGVPAIVVPDNLKSAVRKTHRYEPDINPSYQQLAAHYQTAIVPTRPYKPKDKAKAEVAVQIVERWIMARLRHQTLTCMDALMRAGGRSREPPLSWQHSTRRSVSCWTSSTNDHLKNYPARVSVSSNSWTNRPCGPCRSGAISTSRSNRPVYISIITSSTTNTIIRYRIIWSNRLLRYRQVVP